MSETASPSDKPTAFKHWIGPRLLNALAAELARVQPGIRTQQLTSLVPRLEPLELKDRVRLVRDALHEILPSSYPRALSVLMKVASAPTLKGFDLWPITEFVQTYGLGHFDTSMDALHALTQRFTAEFAVRPFLKRDPEGAFAILRRWAGDPSSHVRRCASEGSRPRLPWGERVPVLIDEPGRGLGVLEALRFDPEIYVRRSVANHLNDIARDHPALVIETLARWRAECPPADSGNLEWVIRHALRGLIKRGHPGALALIGVDGRPRVSAGGLTLDRARVHVGEALGFSFTLTSTTARPQKLVVDYVVHYRKANGGDSPKVFKLKTFTLAGRSRVRIEKRHSLRPVTTRVYYPGEHRLIIQVNGRALLEKTWQLLAPAP